MFDSYGQVGGTYAMSLDFKQVGMVVTCLKSMQPKWFLSMGSEIDVIQYYDDPNLFIQSGRWDDTILVHRIK